MEARSEIQNELYTELEEEVFHELEDFVSDPAFCAALEKRDGLLSRWKNIWGKKGTQHKELTAAPASTATLPATDQQSASSDEATASQSGPECVPPQEGFVVVDKKDVIESMAYYIAASIVDLPEAQAFTPKQLQVALVDALRVLKRSRFQRACTWGRRVYRWTTYTFSAVQMYQNPWLMRALLTALWAASRVTMRVL